MLKSGIDCAHISVVGLHYCRNAKLQDPITCGCLPNRRVPFLLQGINIVVLLLVLLVFGYPQVIRVKKDKDYKADVEDYASVAGCADCKDKGLAIGATGARALSAIAATVMMSTDCLGSSSAGEVAKW
jgi:hypothetical protein